MLLAILLCLVMPVMSFADEEIQKFVSLKGKDVNVRNGPGEEYPVIRVYTGSSMPLAILHRIDNWYMISDYKQRTGWIKVNLVSSAKKSRKIIFVNVSKLCRKPVLDGECELLAHVQRDAVAQVLSCNKSWCRVSFARAFLSGWVKKTDIWGVFNDEII